MSPLFIAIIAVVAVFQLAVLLYAWNMKRVCSALPANEKYTHSLIHMIKVRHQAKTITSFVEMLMSNNHGQLTVSQLDFLHSVQEASQRITHIVEEELSTKPNQQSSNQNTSSTITPPLNHVSVPS